MSSIVQWLFTSLPGTVDKESAMSGTVAAGTLTLHKFKASTREDDSISPIPLKCSSAPRNTAAANYPHYDDISRAHEKLKTVKQYPNICTMTLGEHLYHAAEIHLADDKTYLQPLRAFATSCWVNPPRR
ncbi:uncharacterized protein P174DRAFT_417451 [Aspergillus novofumigatus IBT 16806]|uniref:Uncharacterized protein n=1 Tax=Aspergillus novofumigatus (strain IBT 16806) TaxID=1392255 RepID=A0A2I1CFL2_ASPN1|nr:uncharacterized protein P174DRAFT_417451 [Aspergillus novofumigatus IBT 16806]PKX96412.1 hypothetical protein P174DRAFT_417451 [Aspergillus novofumigatus IBT 16806]